MSEQTLTPQQLALSNAFQQFLFQQQQQQGQGDEDRRESKFLAGEALTKENEVMASCDAAIMVYRPKQSNQQESLEILNQSKRHDSKQDVRYEKIHVPSLPITSSNLPSSENNLIGNIFQSSEMMGNQLLEKGTSTSMMGQYRQLFGSTGNEFEQKGNHKLMIPIKVEAFSREANMVSDYSDIWKVFEDESTPQHVGSDLIVNPSQAQHNKKDYSPQLELTSICLHGSFPNESPQSLRSEKKEDIRLPFTQLSSTSYEEPFALPATMIPPSVLAFASAGGNERKRRAHDKLEKVDLVKRKRLKLQPTITPQACFEQILKSQGIHFYRISADDAQYDTVPSALQLASFGTQLVKAVHTGDTHSLSLLLGCGLSPNPCNQFRDSIVDLICKRASIAVFDCFLDHGCDLQVADGFGRTPLHHACWASSFCAPIVKRILMRDPIQLYIEDKHGQTPLEYVRGELAGEWISFLEQNIGAIFNKQHTLQSPKERRPDGTLADPINSLSVSLAALVSSGTISPNQISQMDEQTRRTYKAKKQF